jgi:hypothetical protein
MSTSDEIRVYLKNKPYIKEALTKKIVNFSALARILQKETGIKNHYAVKAAIIRYAEHLGRTRYDIEAKAIPVLKGSRITVMDSMNVIIANRKLDIVNEAEIKLGDYHIYLTKRMMDKSTIKKFKEDIERINDNCSVILISSPENIEEICGVMAFLTSVFADQGINIVELISFYTETMLLVKKHDLFRAYEILSEITK